MFSHASRERLTDHDLRRFPGDTLFHHLAREVCHAACLPRKELFEAWEVARRVRRRLRGGRIVDMGGGHGLLGHALLLLDDSSPGVLVVDPKLPPSAQRLHETLMSAWPRLAGRVEFVREGAESVELGSADLVVSAHACGALTDFVLSRATAAQARVAVLPCCHDLDRSDTSGLTGWLDGPMAVDVVRVMRLRAAGYRVWTQTISPDITPKNRLLVGAPCASGADGLTGTGSHVPS
jgi:hypothetical protein